MICVSCYNAYRGPKWAEHPDVSWVRGPAMHLGALWQISSRPECGNLMPSAIMVAKVITCLAEFEDIQLAGKKPRIK